MVVKLIKINASLTRHLLLFLLTEDGAEDNTLTTGDYTCFTTFLNTKRRVEDTTCSRVFWTKFKMFGNVMAHCLVYIFSIKTRSNLGEIVKS